MSLPSETDVRVVGGGPAGSTIARRLAEKGIETVLLERERFPRFKPCGGGIPDRTIKLLGPEVEALVREKCHIFKSSYPGHRDFMETGDRPLIHMLKREELDFHLLENARSAGVTVIEGVRVKRVSQDGERVSAETDQGVIRSRYVAGAGGVTGPVARSLGIRCRTRNGRAMMCRLVPESIEDYDRFREIITLDLGVIPLGYGWVFPVGDHLNVGVFSQRTDLKGMRSYLDRYLVRYFPGRSRAELEAVESFNHLLPMGGRREPLHGGRAIVIGDAAGLVDPLTGEGIGYAILSGRIGAGVLAQALSLGDPRVLLCHTQRVQHEIGSHFRASWIISQAMYRFPRLAYAVFTHPRVVKNYRASRDRHLQNEQLPYLKIIADFVLPGRRSSHDKPGD